MQGTSHKLASLCDMYTKSFNYYEKELKQKDNKVLNLPWLQVYMNS